MYLVILLFSLLHLFTSANCDSWTGTFNTRKKMCLWRKWQFVIFILAVWLMDGWKCVSWYCRQEVLNILCCLYLEHVLEAPVSLQFCRFYSFKFQISRRFSSYQPNAHLLHSITTHMLRYNPQHASSNTLLIFRRTNCIITASGIVTLCKRPYSMPVESGEVKNYPLTHTTPS